MTAATGALAFDADAAVGLESLSETDAAEADIVFLTGVGEEGAALFAFAREAAVGA